MSVNITGRPVLTGNQDLRGTSGAWRPTLAEDFVYRVEENAEAAAARDAAIKRREDELKAAQDAREAILPAVLKPDFKAVVGQLDIFRREERQVKLDYSRLQDERLAFNREVDKLNDLGPFLSARLRPELEQQRGTLDTRDANLTERLKVARANIENAERRLIQIADEEFKKNRKELERELRQVQARCVAMDAAMIAAAEVGIVIRSHEARMVQFGEKYVSAPSGFVLQPGRDEWLERWARNEFQRKVW